MPHVMDLQGEPLTGLSKPGRRAVGCPYREADRVDRARFVAPQYRFVGSGSELISQDDPNGDVFTLVEGWISLHQLLEDGRRQILEFLMPGDICGFAPLAGGPAPHSAEALTDVTVMVLSRAQFAAMLATDADYAAAVIGRLSKTISEAHDSLVDIGRRTAMEAVAHLLFRLDRRIREASGAAPGTMVDFPPTQEQLGDALGLSAAHICRTLRVLRERRILSLGRHKLQIHDPAAICRMLGRDEHWARSGRAA